MKFVDVFTHKLTKKILFLITAALIIVTSIITKQHYIRVLPLFVSLFVMLYQTEARRSAFLIGGLNAAFYGFIYFFIVQLPYLYMTTGKTIASTIFTFVSKVASLLFNTLLGLSQFSLQGARVF